MEELVSIKVENLVSKRRYPIGIVTNEKGKVSAAILKPLFKLDKFAVLIYLVNPTQDQGPLELGSCADNFEFGEVEKIVLEDRATFEGDFLKRMETLTLKEI